MPSSELTPLDEIIETFEDLDDWEDRYEYLIELGRELPDFPENLRIDAHRVDGCMSLVWMVTQVEGEADGCLRIRADSDSILVRGLITILLAVFDGRSLEQVAAHDVGALFTRLGLNQHLSSTRRNGLHAMVRRIQADAVGALSRSG